jgi:CheY-like chemotaxis protein
LSPDRGEDSLAQNTPPERDLAGALHEVSNALTVVVGWLEAAREQAEAHGGTDPQLRRALDVAFSRAQLGRRIARNAIAAEVDPSLYESADLAELVQEAALGVEQEAMRTRVGLRLSVGFSAQGKPVGSAASLLQILTNLLLNAIAMSPEGSTVEIETDVQPPMAFIAVTDEGPGMPASYRGSLLEGVPSTRPGGAGIGLKHASALASSRGGSLRVGDSNRGARFELTWPVTPARITMRPSSLNKVSLSGMRVLLVEDDDAVISLLSTALSLRGASVRAARTASELGSLLSQERFDTALLDLSPIAEDIAGAVERVQASSPTVRLVFISGSMSEVPAEAADASAAWVRKPFEVGEVLAVLNDFVRR